MSALWAFVVVDVDVGLPADEVHAYAQAQQSQIIEDWAPFWKSWGMVRVGDKLGPQEDEIEIRLMKHPTIDGALGFHDRKPDGTPIIYVFVELAQAQGDTWTSVASHEVLEVLGDPYLQLCVQIDDVFWDREVCDRVEADSYVKLGVTLSNFNTPDAFEPGKTGGERYDFLGLSTAPNQIRKGGYAQRFDTATGWSHAGEMRGYRAQLARLGLSRGARRQR